MDVRTAEEALEAVSRHPIDLVLSDLNLPGMNGIEFIKALRRIGSSVPAVIISGFLDEQTEEMVKAEGFAAVFRKPVDIRELRIAIERIID